MSEQIPPQESSLHATTLPISQTSSVNVSGESHLDVHGDIIGGNKIVGYTAEQVRTLIAEIRTSYQTKPFDGHSPYVGLASFQEQDAGRFFGRERLTQELVTRIEQTRFLVIAGPSGSGKSSLARAGLMHALRAGALAGSENWLYEILTPGRHPIEALGRTVDNLKDLNAGDDLRQQGRKDQKRLARWLEAALGDQSNRRAILLVDQFEECFTQVTEADERAAFFNLLTYATTIENGRVTIVCCTRSDFIGNWAAYPDLNAQLSYGVNQIPPMQDDELVSAIARPALQVGLPIDPELVKQILDDMRDAPGALPLMQFALDDLFQYEKSKGGVIALTRDDYVARGGLQKALARHADAEFAKLSADEQQVARNVFAGLIEPGRGTVDTKRTAWFEELVPSGSNPSEAQKVIEKLADARLVTTDQVNQHETVTLAHERLIDAWTWLRRLVDENRETIALQNQIAQDGQEWEQHGRDPSYLYTGARLATAQEQLANRKITLSASAQVFVDASITARQAEQKNAQQRTRRLIIAFGAAAVVFAVLAIVALVFQQRAVQSEADALAARNIAETRQAEAVVQKNIAERQQAIARSRELAAVALNQLTLNPERAVLIALEANAALETFEAEDALRQAVTAMPLLRTLNGHTSIISYAEFSPDGKKIVTASSDKTARVWDAVGNSPPVLLQGHSGIVTDAEFSPNSQLIVTASADKTARVWSANTGQELFTLSGHTSTVITAHFSRDGARIVTASADKTARVWDALTGKSIAVLQGHTENVVDADFSPDGKRIVTASNDKTARVWNATTGVLELTLSGHDGVVTRARFSPDGTRIATASGDNTARLWNASNGQLSAELNGHETIVRTVTFSPKGNLLATASNDGTARLWDALSGAPIASLRGHTAEVFDVEFSPDGKRVVTASRDGTARLWDVAANKLVNVLSGHSDIVRSARFSPDGKQVVTAGSDNTARTWDASGGHEIAALLGHTNAINVAHFSPDGERIITASRDNTAKVWDAETGAEQFTLKGHSGDIIAAEFSSNGLVLTASLDKTARLWNASNGAPGPVLEGHHDILRDAHFSPDGKSVVTASSDKQARIWDTTSGATRAILQGHDSAVLTAVFSDDNQRVVTSGLDQTARIWNAITGQQLVVLRGHTGGVLDARFSSDGSRVVTAGDKTARVWDANTGAALLVLNHDANVRVARFSPDAKRIATGTIDGTVSIWDAVNGAKIAELRGLRGAVIDVRWSSDGKWLAGAGVDQTARLWDAVTLDLRAVLYGHRNTITGIDFSPDSTRIITAGQDNIAREYFVNSADLIALAKTRVTRELSCEERVQFLKLDLVCPTPTPN